MDRNQIIGFGLIFALLIAWTFLNSPSQEQVAAMKHRQDSLNRAQDLADSLRAAQVLAEKQTYQPDSATLAGQYGAFSGAATGQNETVRLENEYFSIDFQTLGGRITSVDLKNYHKLLLDDQKKEYQAPLRLMDNPQNIWDLSVPTSRGDLHTKDLYFSPQRDGQKLVLTATGAAGEQIVQTYELTGKPYEIRYTVETRDPGGLFRTAATPVRFTWVNHLDKIERNATFERTYSTVYFKETDESVDYCNCRSDAREDLAGKAVEWIAHSNQFFNSSLIADGKFSDGIFETKMLGDEDDALKITSSVVGIPMSGTAAHMTLYVGPNDFESLRAYHNGLEDIIPFGRSLFGTINRWVIRPLFNFLLSFIGSQGIVILLLTLLVKLALFPLSYKMLQSQAKMQALKPELAGLREKYKDDMQKQQMETMKVYREYGVNPLGGCFPVVLQMPVWFALYRFFPASIEFRQASFLWATDLSSYDVFFRLPFEIPFFGGHISLLTLLWTVSTLVYTYYNMQNMDMSQMNPALKYMQYLMPVMFMAFFNSYASGLTLYLLYSNLLNIGQTLGAKRFLFDQDKIMAGLNKNKAKPKKEGGFQARLEQALKEQQRIAERRKSQEPPPAKKKK